MKRLLHLPQRLFAGGKRTQQEQQQQSGSNTSDPRAPPPRRKSSLSTNNEARTSSLSAAVEGGGRRPAPPSTPTTKTREQPEFTPAETEHIALRNLIATKLSYQVLLLIHLLPGHSDEFLYLICRKSTGEEAGVYFLDGISPKLKSTFSYKLADLLHFTEEPDVGGSNGSHNLVTLHFSGSRSVTVCLDAEEKNWLFYCTTRLCREFAANERVSIVTSNNLRLRTSEQVLRVKCPILLHSVKTPDVVRIATPPRSLLNASMFAAQSPSTPEPSYEARLFAAATSASVSAQNEVETKPKLLNDIFPATQAVLALQEGGEEERWFARVELENVTLAEQETMRDLSMWEACAGGGKSNDGAMSGRSGDPVALMLHHLENVEARLAEVEAWMSETQDKSSASMQRAQDLTKELAVINNDTAFKTRLAAHLEGLLQ